MANKRKSTQPKKIEPSLEVEQNKDDVFDLLNKVEDASIQNVVEESPKELNYDQLMELMDDIVNKNEVTTEESSVVEVTTEESSVVEVTAEESSVVEVTAEESSVVEVTAEESNKKAVLRLIQEFEKSITFNQMVKKHHLENFLYKLKTIL